MCPPVPPRHFQGGVTVSLCVGPGPHPEGRTKVPDQSPFLPTRLTLVFPTWTTGVTRPHPRPRCPMRNDLWGTSHPGRPARTLDPKAYWGRRGRGPRVRTSSSPPPKPKTFSGSSARESGRGTSRVPVGTRVTASPDTASTATERSVSVAHVGVTTDTLRPRGRPPRTESRTHSPGHARKHCREPDVVDGVEVQGLLGPLFPGPLSSLGWGILRHLPVEG